MSGKRIEMHELQEVVRLHRQGQSKRRIARLLRMGRDTISKYLEKISAAGLLVGSPDDLPNPAALSAAVGLDSAPIASRNSSADPWKSQIAKKFEGGAGPTSIHDYLRLHEKDYAASLSAVKRMCLRLKKDQGPQEADIAIPVETFPGEVAQVDFGYVGKIYDPEKGVLRKAWVFVMTLGFSRCSYLEIVFDQKIQTWLLLHVCAFEYFGGVPKVIVPDNLKSAVIRCAFGIDDKLLLNRSYRELARYYDFQIDPTPPRSPEKKGKVERDVRYVKGSFFATWESVDIKVDNEELRRWNQQIADKRVHGTTKRRPIELFEQKEQQALTPLPKRRWELVIWKKAKLHRDSHVQVDGAFYSAPWIHVGKSLWVRSTAHDIELFDDTESLYRHGRAKPGQRSTVDSHLPEARSELRHRSRGYWIDRARNIGPEVEHLVEEIFGSDDVLLQLRRVQAVVTHLGGFPVSRARAAAARALHFGSLEYRSIKSILSKGLDLEALPGSKTRSWSEGSTFARNPDYFLDN
ncbi:MAG: IS21 family transposase [Planctomycetota bacterium]